MVRQADIREIRETDQMATLADSMEQLEALAAAIHERYATVSVYAVGRKLYVRGRAAHKLAVCNFVDGWKAAVTAGLL